MSILLVIPIVAIAVYGLYRHIKGEFSGKGSCCGCSASDQCSQKQFPHDTPSVSKLS